MKFFELHLYYYKFNFICINQYDMIWWYFFNFCFQEGKTEIGRVLFFWKKYFCFIFCFFLLMFLFFIVQFSFYFESNWRHSYPLPKTETNKAWTDSLTSKSERLYIWSTNNTFFKFVQYTNICFFQTFLLNSLSTKMIVIVCALQQTLPAVCFTTFSQI